MTARKQEGPQATLAANCPAIAAKTPAQAPDARGRKSVELVDRFET
jgi:hypothetical protein